MNETALLKKQAKKYIDTADEKVVKMIHAMLQVNAEADWWDDVSDAAKKSIDKGLQDVAAGKVKSHKGVMKKYKKWL